jgi:four helix bundle protein
MPECVEKLEIWQDAMERVKTTYALTKTWPKEELYGLTSQARRAAVSIPANLAEGLGRGTKPGDRSQSTVACGRWLVEENA